MEDENAVAVIGIACRFPGADDTDEFWENLKEGKCFIDEVPEERWNVDKADVKDADISWKKCASHAALISEYVMGFFSFSFVCMFVCLFP